MTAKRGGGKAHIERQRFVSGTAANERDRPRFAVAVRDAAAHGCEVRPGVLPAAVREAYRPGARDMRCPDAKKYCRKCRNALDNAAADMVTFT